VGALAAVALIAVGTWMLIHTPTGGPSPVARVEMVKPVSSSHGQVVASLVGPGPEDPNQAQVAVEYEQVPDNEFSLAAGDEHAQEAWAAPTGTVLMVGVSPKQPDQPANNLADLLLE